jgi:hypothetical protein
MCSAASAFSPPRRDARLRADESFPAPAIRGLEAAGHDVLSVRLTAPGLSDPAVLGLAAPGLSDPAVLGLAAREARILLTFDKNFGELARRVALPAACGVVLFRIPMPKPGEVGADLVRLLNARDD